MFLKDKWKLKCEWWEEIKQKNSIPKGGEKEWAIILNAYQQRTLLLAFGRAKGHCKESQKSAAFQSTLLSTLKSYVYIASRGLSRGIWKSLLCFFSQRQGEYIFPYKNKESWKKFLRSIVAPGVLPWGIPMPSGAGQAGVSAGRAAAISLLGQLDMGRACVSSPSQLTAVIACRGFKAHMCCLCSPKMTRERAEGRCAPFPPAALFHATGPRPMTERKELLLQGFQQLEAPCACPVQGQQAGGPPQPEGRPSPTLSQYWFSHPDPQLLAVDIWAWDWQWQ